MTLRLPKLLDDGCVLQSGRDVRIWGWADAGARVTVDFEGITASVEADCADGAWCVSLQSPAVGGPFKLHVESSSGERLERSCYVGEVFLCSGQSNMELPMAWVKADYPQEWKRDPDPLLRQYKVIPDYDFAGPRSDHERASWYGCSAETLDDFSALAYFFGRRIRDFLNVPVGLLNVSLGGSPIESWMNAETLRDFPETLAQLEPYLGEGVARRRSEDSVAARDSWYQALGYDAVADAHHEPVPLITWDCPESKTETPQDLQWRDIELPGWYADLGFADFRGEIELRKTVFLPDCVEGQPALLRLGTMNDADHTWVNGMLVGGRSNVYEPRDYEVPADVLHAGANEIRIRLVVERSGGRVTPGKSMMLTMGDETFDLSGTWQCSVIQRADHDCPFEDFVRWKPTGLYNAMLAPCFPYAVRAALWYQGESNTGDYATQYGNELQAMIELWRNEWNQPDMPFLIVQLPNFAIDAIEDGGWPIIREQEWKVAETVANTATVVSLDAGEGNDLHPHNKKLIADRLFDAAQALVYGRNAKPQPCIISADAEHGLLRMRCGWADVGECENGSVQSQGLSLNTLDGKVPGEIVFFWSDSGTVAHAESWIDGDCVMARLPNRKPDEVRYAWCNNPNRGLLCDTNGTLLPPFRLRITD